MKQKKSPTWIKWGEIGLLIGIILLGFLAFLVPYDIDFRIVLGILILPSLLGISIGKIKSTKLYSWLKGGIIALLILIIIGLFPSIIYHLVTNCYGEDCFFADMLSGLFVLPISLFFGGESYILLLILTFLFYFIIGTLIGFIVGKIKSKKRKR